MFAGQTFLEAQCNVYMAAGAAPSKRVCLLITKKADCAKYGQLENSSLLIESLVFCRNKQTCLAFSASLFREGSLKYTYL